VPTGLVHAGHYRRRRRREFLDFMNELVAKNPDKEIHVVLDNLNTHKPNQDRWLKVVGRKHGGKFQVCLTIALWCQRNRPLVRFLAEACSNSLGQYRGLKIGL
jgi:hypothetical protein